MKFRDLTNTLRRRLLLFLVFFTALVFPAYFLSLTKNITVELQEATEVNRLHSITTGAAAPNSAQRETAIHPNSNFNHHEQQQHMLLQQKEDELNQLKLELFQTKQRMQQELNHSKLRSQAEELPLRRQQQQQIQIQKQQDHNYVSLCLMVMDANHEIIEWLAYHYHTLNVRRMIVYNDPNSRTTPLPILQRWQNRINITLWDAKNGHPGYDPEGSDDGPHEDRQLKFYVECYKTLKQEGRRWVAAFDPDEYVTINERVYIPGEPMYQMGLFNVTGRFGTDTQIDPIHIPTAREPGSTIQFIHNTMAHIQKYGLRNHKINAVYLKPFETSCIQANRKQYSPYEEDPNRNADVGHERKPLVVLQIPNATTDPPFPFHSQNEQQLDSSLNPSDLSTWRWRYWGRMDDHRRKRLWNHVGKAILDFDRLHEGDITKKPNIHAPLDEPICSQALKWENEQMMPLVMHHYPLTWEQAMFRAGDSRGNRRGKTFGNGNFTAYRMERFLDELNQRDAYEPHGHILEWLLGFVESVGLKEAARLLQHASNPMKAAQGAWLDPNQIPNATANAIPLEVFLAMEKPKVQSTV